VYRIVQSCLDIKLPLKLGRRRRRLVTGRRR
jgi:hypothetical protein